MARSNDTSDPGKPNSSVAERFGRNLRRERERLGVSQEELSSRADVHRTEVSHVERGLRVPRIDTLVQLAGSLGIEPEDLLEGLKWAPGKKTPGGFV